VGELSDKMAGGRSGFHDCSSARRGFEEGRGNCTQAGRAAVKEQMGVIQADGLLMMKEQGGKVVPG